MSQQLMKVTGDIKSLSFRDMRELGRHVHAALTTRPVVREPTADEVTEALLTAALNINPDVDTMEKRK